jgi:hypothetical protein
MQAAPTNRIRSPSPALILNRELPLCLLRNPSSCPGQLPKCLRIPEIVRMICNDLSPRSLIRLAISCKGLSGPSLDVLWYELDGFLRLTRCIPNLWDDNLVLVGIISTFQHY